MSDQASPTYSELSPLVPCFDLAHLKPVADKENRKKIEKHQRFQEKKLIRLQGGTNPIAINNEHAIFNFSNRVLTQEEKRLLSRGRNFPFPEKKIIYKWFTNL